MELSDLGYDEWFRLQREQRGVPELSVARVTRVDRERYHVRNEHGEIQAEATGRLLFAAESGEDLPSVGDWVLVQYYNDGQLGIIHEVLPRKTFLRRKAAGKTADRQMIASNIDTAFIMQSCDLNFNLRRMERYIVVARDGHIEPVILLSKRDLVDDDELERMVNGIRQAHIDAPVVAVSSLSTDGAETVRRMLARGKTYCLLGSSGVGKTTLLNLLLGRDVYETAPVREKDSRGRHTTVRRQLEVLEEIGALMIDTPGMRELGVTVSEESIDESFPDISALTDGCRFKDCTHTVEAGCAVREAVASGMLEEERYQSYLKLVKEAAFHQMSYVERRRKDREFGRMVNTILKGIKHRKS